MKQRESRDLFWNESSLAKAGSNQRAEVGSNGHQHHLSRALGFFSIFFSPRYRRERIRWPSSLGSSFLFSRSLPFSSCLTSWWKILVRFSSPGSSSFFGWLGRRHKSKASANSRSGEKVLHAESEGVLLPLVSATLHTRCYRVWGHPTLEKSLGFEGVIYDFGNRVERRGLQKLGPSSKIQLGPQHAYFLTN